MFRWLPGRAARQRPDPLGTGVWRRAHDRFHRAVDRVHQILDGVPDGPVHDALAEVAVRLADLTGQVRAVGERAQAVAPSSAAEVPGGHGGRLLDLHRALSRAGTAAAQAAEAATMARVAQRAGDDGTARERVAAARRAADAAAALVHRAGDLASTLDPEG